MPFVKGYLRTVKRDGRPDNSLPDEVDEVDPDYGVEAPEGPIDPGFGVGLPPIISHPIVRPGHEHPSHPIAPTRPTYPVDPNYGLPVRPGLWPTPPRPPGVDNTLPMPPLTPSHPIYPIPPSGGLPPGAVWPPMPPGVSGKLLCMVWIVGVGYRWAALDADIVTGGDGTTKPVPTPTPPMVTPPDPTVNPQARRA